MQIELAFNQIGKDKEIKMRDMEPDQLEMIQKAMGMEEKLDEKRGVSHAR